MTTNFSIKECRIGELKDFIKKELPSARFNYNPYLFGNKWNISLTMDIEDSNKLNLLHNKWYDEDKPVEKQKISIFKKIFGIK